MQAHAFLISLVRCICLWFIARILKDYISNIITQESLQDYNKRVFDCFDQSSPSINFKIHCGRISLIGGKTIGKPTSGRPKGGRGP